MALLIRFRKTLLRASLSPLTVPRWEGRKSSILEGDAMLLQVAKFIQDWGHHVSRMWQMSGSAALSGTGNLPQNPPGGLAAIGFLARAF
jgi:hypothetical protein